MPESSLSHLSPSDPGLPCPPGYTLRVIRWFRDGAWGDLRCLLPLSVTDEELKQLNRDAIQSMREHDERKKASADEVIWPSRPQSTTESDSDPAEKPDPSREPVRSRSGDLDIPAERDYLLYQAQQAQGLLRRSFSRIARAKVKDDGDHSGYLMVPVMDAEEVLQLLMHKTSTPDPQVHRRNRELFLRIRKEHPHALRPVGYRLRDHQAVLAELDQLAQSQPHFAQVVQHVQDHLVLCYARRQPMRIPPVLLLGEPGIGKTHFTHALARALRLPVHRHGLDSGVTGSSLMGSASHWANTSYGLVFDALVLGKSASPVILLDEIDKACRDGNRVDPLGPLHSLLEPVSARAVQDISVHLTFDASHVVWIATANERRDVPEPLCSRFHEFEIQTPRGEQALQAAFTLAASVHARMGARLFDAPPIKLVVALAHLPAREFIHALESAYGRALRQGSRIVQRHHLAPGVLQASQDKPERDDRQDPDDMESHGSLPDGGYLH